MVIVCNIATSKYDGAVQCFLIIVARGGLVVTVVEVLEMVNVTVTVRVSEAVVICGKSKL